MKLVKSPLIEERLALEDSGRANQLRDLWMRLGTIEDRANLEELWPAMKGRWFGQFGLPTKTDPDLERITSQIKKSDDPNEVRKDGLKRIWRKMTGQDKERGAS